MDGDAWPARWPPPRPTAAPAPTTLPSQVNLPGEGSTSTIDGMSNGALQFQDSSAAQMMLRLASNPTPRHQPAPLTDRIHVSCLNVGGELFVGDAGLFGVLCSCHQLRMSVAKFCEHAGGPAEKAGEIVLMENGMSIAHWFKYCVGVGSYVTDTKCDRPEWACIDSSLACVSVFLLALLLLPLDSAPKKRDGLN